MQNNRIFKNAEKMLPGVQPLRNRKKEQFCQLYAGNLWGRPGEAWNTAMGIVKSVQESRICGEHLLEESLVRQRVEYLRSLRAKNSIADNAWIKESLVRIASESGKVADRIRALTNLNRILVLEQQHEQRKQDQQENSDFLQLNLPLFEGPQDGSGHWYQDAANNDKKPEKTDRQD